jgi:hypothetical protein
MHGLKSNGIKPAGPPVQRVYDIAEVQGLRELRETVGMYCEQLPEEVRDALHAVPEIEKTHG